MTSSGSKLLSLGFALIWNKSQEQSQSSRPMLGWVSEMESSVIEALGAGNLPPLAAREITKLMEKGVPVVLVSRCFNGIAEPVYAYEGGGVKLQEAGVMFVKELNAPKARLKLLIALSAGLKDQELKDYIEG